MDLVCLLPLDILDDILKQLIIKHIIQFMLTNKHYYQYYEKLEEYIYYKAKTNMYQFDTNDLFFTYCTNKSTTIPYESDECFQLSSNEYVIFDDVVHRFLPIYLLITIDSNYIYHVYDFEKVVYSDDYYDHKDNEAYLFLSERKFVQLKDFKFKYVNSIESYVLNEISNI
ncbi:MAG TPA: hypothetical protein VLG50_08165 [Candidatus Saccharimonadales bacterium]|nr:hypothetical protein [Candidatus Saccharimonadales bacterium]